MLTKRTMKTPTLLLLLALIASPAISFGQQQPRLLLPPPAPASTAAPVPASSATDLPVFDLDFAGGTPAQLVAAIEKASGTPLNVIIPEEYAATQIPGLKMKGVNVARLFDALQRASVKEVASISGYNRDQTGEKNPVYTYQREDYGFQTEGQLRTDSVWYFHRNSPAPLPPSQPSPVCQFYQLGSYLDSGYKVEDITTAIETGWKMLGVKTPPTLNFHKETKLLIAVGYPEQLILIDSVLGRLQLKPAPLPRPGVPSN